MAVTGGPAAGQALALDRPVTVGRSPACDVVTPDPRSRPATPASTSPPSGQVTVTDLGSHNGTLVDGVAVEGTATVPVDALVQLGATDVRVRRFDEADRHLGVDPRHSVGGVVPFNRPPRTALPEAPAEIDAPDTRPGDEATKPPFNALALVAPLVMAGVMVALYGSIRYAMFGLLSPVMMMGNWVSARRRAGREFKGATRAYRDALSRLDGDLAAAVSAEGARREALLPDAAEVVRRAHLPSVWLWERRPGHADFLTLRVGTGDLRWRPPLARARSASPPAEVAELAERHGVLPLAAVDVGLRDGPVGIVGDRAAALALARSLVCQAAVHHGARRRQRSSCSPRTAGPTSGTGPSGSPTPACPTAPAACWPPAGPPPTPWSRPCGRPTTAPGPRRRSRPRPGGARRPARCGSTSSTTPRSCRAGGLRCATCCGATPAPPPASSSPPPRTSSPTSAPPS